MDNVFYEFTRAVGLVAAAEYPDSPMVEQMRTNTYQAYDFWVADWGIPKSFVTEHVGVIFNHPDIKVDPRVIETIRCWHALGHRVVVLTTPWGSPSSDDPAVREAYAVSSSAKLAWLNANHVPYDSVMFTGDKSLLPMLDAFIDDQVSNHVKVSTTSPDCFHVVVDLDGRKEYYGDVYGPEGIVATAPSIPRERTLQTTWGEMLEEARLLTS